MNLQPQILAMMKAYNMKDPLKAAMETCDFKTGEGAGQQVSKMFLLPGGFCHMYSSPSFEKRTIVTFCQTCFSWANIPGSIP